MSARPPQSDGVEILLRDGSTVHVRPTRRSDRAKLEEFFASLSERSRQLRFFSAAANLGAVALLAVEAPDKGGFGLVATLGDDRILAHAMYGSGGVEAEVAFAVADELHGTGIATILLAHLAERAAAAGIQTFNAEVLPENHRMLEVFRDSGFALETRSLPGVIALKFPTALSPEARVRFEDRERIAAASALRSVLRPSSVAVIGASRTPGNVGHETVRNLQRSGFTGVVHAVNTRGGTVATMPAHRTLSEVPGPVDLAVIATPAATVPEVARQCAAKGVRALVVLSAGFGEAGEDGAARQRELVEVCRAAGMRLIGPNCIGVMNTAPEVRLNASFAPAFPPPGSVGFLSQSGALGLAIIDRAADLGLGISSFVSYGNRADISGNDVLQFWEDDDATDVIVLYLESFENPRKFARIARRVASSKPILAVKSGRSAAGAKATSSHTGALVSASDITVDALFRQSGVIRSDTLAELFDVARLLATQPVPQGSRVAIVTNAGGLGILCADACEGGGIEVTELPQPVRAELASFLAPTASTANPVDMIATASADDYRRALRVIADSGAVDGIIAIFIPPLVTRPEDVADALNDAADEIGGRLPVAAVFSSHELPPQLAGRAAHLPVYAYPEDAAVAFGHAAGYGRWLGRDHGRVPQFADTDGDRAAATIADALEDGGGWLRHEQTAELLDCYGLAMPPWLVTDATPEAVADATRELGGKVAIKAVARGLLHKSDTGGVATGVTARGAAAAARRIAAGVERGGHELEGFLVQSMARPGVEMLVGTVSDPTFGAVLVCGGGGVAAEVIGDVSVRVTPVTDRDAREMVESLRTYPLLTGYRGTPPVDLGAVENVILRLGALVEAHPEVVEVDLNPVIASERGGTVVDARMRVEPPPPRPPWPSLGR